MKGQFRAISLLCVMLLGLGLLPDSSQAAPGDINLVAGNGSTTFSGDGGLATLAGVKSPQGVAVDSLGNLYIADLNHGIRKVDTSGNISTVAGTPPTGGGVAGSNGDGGLATLATLKAPQGVAVDGAGNLYIADGLSRLVRKVNKADGKISTFAGTGVSGNGGDGGAATSATLSFPWGVAVDGSNNVYIADQSGSRVRKVTSGGIISTVAAGALSGPTGVAVDGSGNIYIADSLTNKVTKVTVATGVVSTVAGTGSSAYSGDNGPATSAGLSAYSVTLDGAGNLYIADQANARIRKVDAVTGIISTVAGSASTGSAGNNGPATSARLNLVTGVVADSAGNFWISDQTNDSVRYVSAKIVPVVAAAPLAGTYFTSQSVVLTSSITPATIYYTLDGSDPTVVISASRKTYTGAIPISATTTLKYYAVDGAAHASVVGTQVYTLLAATKPNAPTIAAVAAGDTVATVSFTAPSNGGSAITGYTVTSNPSGGVDFNAGATTLTHSMTHLTNGISYTFTVIATNNIGPSDPSVPSNSVVPAAAVNGSCGSADGGSFSLAPTSNLCISGSASAAGSFQGSWTWLCNGANGGGTASCQASILAAPTTFPIPLVQGWNMISLPLQPSQTGADLVLAGLNYRNVWGYSAGNWQLYDPSSPLFSDLTDITSGAAYWIYANAPTTLQAQGAAALQSVPLITGWNFVGYGGLVSQDVVAGTASLGSNLDQVWNFSAGAWQLYDPSSPLFSDLATLDPGKGYWIKMKQPATWTLP